MVTKLDIQSVLRKYLTTQGQPKRPHLQEPNKQEWVRFLQSEPLFELAMCRKTGVGAYSVLIVVNYDLYAEQSKEDSEIAFKMAQTMNAEVIFVKSWYVDGNVRQINSDGWELFYAEGLEY